MWKSSGGTRWISSRSWASECPRLRQAAAGPAARRALRLAGARDGGGSIFISYSHLDLDAVKKIKTALEDAGCTVWFDQERLRVGDSSGDVPEEQVREQCSLFLSIISLTTERRPGYYHTERSWAEARALRHGKAVADFYIPVVIDDMPTLHLPGAEGRGEVPDHPSVPGGETPGDFAHWVRELRERALNLNWPPRR